MKKIPSFPFLASILILGTILCWSLVPPPPPTTYYSIADGDFESGATWSTTSHLGSSCSCSPGCTVGNNEEVRIAHTVTSTCNPLATSGTGDLIIEANGSLTITGDGGISGNGNIDVQADGLLTINGDLNISGNGGLMVDGALGVTGDVNITGSGTACGDGSAEIGGNLSGSGWCSSISVLPIELLSFDAALLESGEIEIRWVTAAEINNDYFYIERSINGYSFEEIAQVDGAGHSESTLEYSIVDSSPPTGTFYYRLTQVDFNGTSETFDIIAIQRDAENGGKICSIKIIPNPCVPHCKADLTDCPNGTAQIHLMDVSGNIIEQKIEHLNEDSPYEFIINKDNNLVPGVYVVRVAMATGNQSEKVIVR